MFRELPRYSGWVVVEAEQDPKKPNPLPYATKGDTHLTRALRGGGPRLNEVRRPIRRGCHVQASAQAEPAPAGRAHRVTPATAGWTHVSFDLHDLSPDEAARPPRRVTGRYAWCSSPARSATSAAGTDFGTIGEHDLARSAALPWSRLRAGGGAFHAVVTAEGPSGGRDLRRPGRARPPAGAADRPARGRPRDLRGQGRNTRHLRNASSQRPSPHAEGLLVVEVIAPAGCWSSYPAHKHDQDGLPAEILLEETYYHRLNPPQGFGFQRVYTDDRSLDETLSFRDRDVELVPRATTPSGRRKATICTISTSWPGPEAHLEVPQRPGPCVAAGRLRLAEGPSASCRRGIW